MATVTTRPFDRPALDRRVRHPLQALRGYIRTYVSLEGAAVALIYMALWFWIGLLLDYGTFRLFAFDWIQELNQNVPESTATIVRVVLLGILGAGLLAVVAAKVFLRLFREFRDAPLALVLERRFPRELGDRLITAVELADPRLAVAYGYSQAMVDATIQDAADRVEKLPVREVFDWARLRGQWLVAAVLTLGVYLLVAFGSCTLPLLFGAEAPTPGQFVWRMRAISAIWFERSILLENSYWPRRAYLEVIRFQETSEHPGEMRVGRDEQRPDVLVRAVEWVIADPQAADGWRALRWSDLLKWRELPTNRVSLPAAWPAWVIDLDDLDPEVPPGVLPPEWQGKQSGFLRTELARPEHRAAISQAHAEDAVERLLDWQTWTIDKIELQLQRRDVREAFRAAGQEASLQGFENVLSELSRLADNPHMSRTLRQLKVPAEVRVNFRGKTTKSSNTQTLQEDHKYSIKLDQLKESVRFTVLGEDYYTPSLSITLVPPPAISHLSVTREEPAYLYYRGDQKLLQGKKQIFRDVGVSITGETSTIQVPLGTNIEVKAQADRELRGDIRMVAPANREEAGSVTPAGQVRLLEDKRTFMTQFAGVARPIEFDYEFHDRDNVRGRRRIVVKPIDDRAPEIIDVEMAVVLRKPRFKVDAGKSGQNPAADGYLVTPRALIPFKGTIRDDYGLTRAAWSYEIEQVEFELLGDPRGDKKQGPGLVLIGSAASRRARYIAAGHAFLPVGLDSIAPAGWAWIAQLVKADLVLTAKQQAPEEGAVPLERFQRRLEEHAGDELTPAALESRLTGPPPRSTLLKEHSLKEEEGFDFNKYLAKLQSKDPQKEAQLHYQVRLAITATDNNVETGPGTGRTKMPLNFLIVSENELLAQVLVEEDGLRERLEKAVHRLRDHKSILDEQVGKVDDPKSDLGLIAIRVEEVRKSILDGAGAAREVYADYSRILHELEANRVSPEKIVRVDNQICKPLEAVIQPKGEFAVTDEMVQNLSQALEGDAARQKAAEDAKKMDAKLQEELATSRLGHRKALVQSRDSLMALIDRLEAVLRAMDQELVLGNVVGLLVEIERAERQAAARWDAYHAEVIADIFRELGGAETPPNNPQKR